jgi:basic amino acid/polyamine antiporter, APA family
VSTAGRQDTKQQRFGLPSATALVIASMVGTGVFTTTGFLISDLRSPFAVFLAWLVGGLLAAAGALSYAELSVSLPRNGGEYQLLGRIYHPAVGFAAGVISLVVGFAAPTAAAALAFGHYLAAAVPGVPPLPASVSIIVVLAISHGVNAALGGRAQTAITIAQVVLIAAATMLGALLTGSGQLVSPVAVPSLDAVASPQFAVALVFVSFAYSGWNGATYIAGEVRNPARTLPVALITGTLIVTVLYVGLNLVVLAAVPAEELAGVVEVAHLAAGRLAGPIASRILSGVIALTLASSVGAMLMSGPRVSDAIGRDHRVLSFLAHRTRGGAPVVAVTSQAALALVMVVTASFGTLLAYMGFTLSVSAGLTVLGVLVLRVREPQLDRPYRAWGYPVTPLLFVALSAWMVGHSFSQRPSSSLAGLATVSGALLLYVLTSRSGRRQPSAASN